MFQFRYEQFKGTLRLGTEMPSPILLWPPPKPVRIVADFDVIEAHMEGTIDIKGYFQGLPEFQKQENKKYNFNAGFLTLADVSSPPILSKHIVFPYIMRQIKQLLKLSFRHPLFFLANGIFIFREDGSMSTLEEDARTPTLGVFVHGPLKNENMCALVQVKHWKIFKTKLQYFDDFSKIIGSHTK